MARRHGDFDDDEGTVLASLRLILDGPPSDPRWSLEKYRSASGDEKTGTVAVAADYRGDVRSASPGDAAAFSRFLARAPRRMPLRP